MVVEIEGKSIAVFNVDGRHYAMRSVCPHQGGPLCAGTVGGTMLPSEPHRYIYGKEGRVVRCPWHGWEFDLESGRALSDPRLRVRMYPVAVDDGGLVVDV